MIIKEPGDYCKNICLKRLTKSVKLVKISDNIENSEITLFNPIDSSQLNEDKNEHKSVKSLKVSRSTRSPIMADRPVIGFNLKGTHTSVDFEF